MAARQISAAEAVKAFRSQSVKVRVATPTKVKGEDGKTREGFSVEMAPLTEAHVLSAVDYGDRIVMTTINGRKYETAAKAAIAA